MGLGQSTLRQNEIEPDKETFGAATGVSDPRLQKILSPQASPLFLILPLNFQLSAFSFLPS